MVINVTYFPTKCHSIHTQLHNSCNKIQNAKI